MSKIYNLLVLLVAVASSKAAVYYNCTTSGMVALTFDDGPGANHTNEILDILKSFDLKATFFINGLYNYETNETRYMQTIKRIFDEKHQLGSHAWNHSSLTNLTQNEIRSELTAISDKVGTSLKVNLTIFRPPLGEYNDLVIKVAEEKFGYEIVMWNVDTKDWDHPGDSEAGLQVYKDAIEGGSVAESTSFIGLHHDPLEGSEELTQLTIEYLLSQNMTIVPISECIGKEMYVKLESLPPGSTTENSNAILIQSLSFYCFILCISTQLFYI